MDGIGYASARADSFTIKIHSIDRAAHLPDTKGGSGGMFTLNAFHSHTIPFAFVYPSTPVRVSNFPLFVSSVFRQDGDEILPRYQTSKYAICQGSRALRSLNNATNGAVIGVHIKFLVA